ncbi:partial, partial [Paramuricea clavata]
MKILLNGLLLSLWITFCCSLASNALNSEEADFYRSLTTNENAELNSNHVHRGKRSVQKDSQNQVYESEIKILGHIESEARDRVVRSSGDSEYSISEIPIETKISHENYIDPKLSYDDPNSSSNDQVTVTDLSSVDSKPSDNDRAVSTSSGDSKSSDTDIGTGIEVESEEKLSDEDPDELQTTSQSTVGEITVSSRADISREVLWPSGTYGLPKPKSGCPESSGFLWKTGTRFYDTEDDGTENHNSDAYHLAGDVTEDGITWEFCMKTKDVGLKSWPQGKYCIYKKGAGCPGGLQAGFVYWDDENIDNKNHFNGDLPEGEYTDKTKILFCCSTTGKAESEIVLPTEKPFYLFPYGDTACQKVAR